MRQNSIVMPSTTSLPLRVLVVDSDAAARAALCARLQGMGLRVRPAAGIGEAAAWAGSGVPIDALMWAPSPADGDAGRACARLRAADAYLPIVVVLDAQDDAQALAVFATGADDLVQGELDDALLGARLARHAQRAAMLGACRRQLERQRGIQDNIADPVITVDDHGTVLDLNTAAMRRFAAPGAAALAGQPLEAVIGAAPRQLATGERVWLRGVEGAGFWAQASASRWGEDGSARTTWVLRDLTETMRNERMHDEFLASVSHELRTPLTSILGAVGLLASGVAGRLPPTAAPLVAAAQRNGERLSKLIDDVLDLAKLEGDRMTLQCQTQALAPLAGEAVSAAQAYAARAGVHLRLRCPASTPCTGRGVSVDADRLLQVLANLISNAIKHSAPGQTVVIELSDAGDGQRIAVTDEGKGVPKDFRPHLFEKFAQAGEGDQRGAGGTGLGLHLARVLVQRMGGRIGYAPGPGEVGSTFDVWFPAVAASRPARARVAP